MLSLKSENVFLLAMLVVISTQVHAVRWNDGNGGAARDYYNLAAKLPWAKKLGDWKDANEQNWGPSPFSIQKIISQPSNSKVSFDVTTLVNSWKVGKFENEGFFLRGIKGRSVIEFFSKENGEQVRPRLVITTDLDRYFLIPIADTYLDGSTYKSLGRKKLIKVTSSSPSLIYFDLDLIQKDETIISAKLELTVRKIYNRGLLEIGVFQVSPAPESSEHSETKMGLASAYSWDKGLEDSPDVYHSTGFEERSWTRAWMDGGKMGRVESANKKQNNFEPLSGNALSATMDKGKNSALNQRFKFVDNGFTEPEKAYFRYYLRLGDNWNQTVSGGKLPGFAGTYNKAGWGSRKPDGTNGWSARGSFLKTIMLGSEKLNPIGSYVYHVDQYGNYGSGWTWDKQGGALLKNNRWYCIEQYIQVNTPGNNDGVFMAWLDGKKVFEKKGLKFRTTNDLKIEEVWLNIYHGGMALSPRDQTAYIDNFVVAKKYIGPINMR